jgi:hypothetical protein
MTFLRAFIIWLVIIFAESLHGAARVLFLEPYVGDFKARQIAVFTGSAMILAIALAAVRWLRAGGLSQLIRVGLMWLFLTLGFEISLGRFVAGYSWERIASDYKLSEGGLLPIGLLVMTVAPAVAAYVRNVDLRLK